MDRRQVLGFIVVFLFLFIFSIGFSSPIQCSLKTTDCASDEGKVFYLANPTNSHVYWTTSYTDAYRLCCKNITDATLSSGSCSAGTTPLVSIYDPNDGTYGTHVLPWNGTYNYTNKICLSPSSTLNNINCILSTGSSCPIGYGKVLGLYKIDNLGSHVEGPSGTEGSYSVCCEIFPSCTSVNLGTPVIEALDGSSSPKDGQWFLIKCPTEVRDVDCVGACANGTSMCVDGVNVKFVNWETRTGGYYAVFNVTTGMSTGSYTARCYVDTDASSNCCPESNTTTSYTVTTDNPPTCSIQSIQESSVYAYASGSTVYYNNLLSSGSFTVTVSASDDVGINHVNFPGTVSSGGDDFSSPYSWTYSWNTSDTHSGLATVTAYDTAGQTGTCQFNVIRDVAKPTTSVDISNSGQTYYITLSCSDSESGCQETRYCVGDSGCTPTNTYTGTITYTCSSCCYLKYYSVDNVNNTENTHTTTFGPYCSCIRDWPDINILPYHQSGGAGDTLTYTVMVTNKDQSCSFSNFSVTIFSCPNGFTCRLNQTTIYDLSPGEAGNVTLNVTSPATASSGNHTFGISAENLNSNYKDTNYGKYEVLPCHLTITSATVPSDLELGQTANQTVYVKNIGGSGCYGFVQAGWTEPDSTYITVGDESSCQFIGKDQSVSYSISRNADQEGTWAVNSVSVYRSQSSNCSNYVTPPDDKIPESGNLGTFYVCSNECTNGQADYQCSGDSLQQRTCGQYDSDPCTEWSSWSSTNCSDQDCSTGVTCSISGDVLTKSGDDYSCSDTQGKCIKVGTKTCGTWTCDSSTVGTTVDCGSSTYHCCDLGAGTYGWTTSSCNVCYRHNPGLIISPKSQSGNAGDARTYTVTVTNKDSSSCGSSTFSLAHTSISGWAIYFSSSSLSISPGENATSTLYIISPGSASKGVYDVTVTATNQNASSYFTEETASYVLGGPCDLTIESINITPQVKCGTGRVNITVEVMNRGGASCNGEVQVDLLEPRGSTYSTEITDHWSGGETKEEVIQINADQYGVWNITKVLTWNCTSTWTCYLQHSKSDPGSFTVEPSIKFEGNPIIEPANPNESQSFLIKCLVNSSCNPLSECDIPCIGACANGTQYCNGDGTGVTKFVGWENAGSGLFYTVFNVSGLSVGSYDARCFSTCDCTQGSNEVMSGYIVSPMDTNPPTVSISISPSSPDETQVVEYTATATDDVSGIQRIEIYVNNSLKKTCTSSPCTYQGGPYPSGSTQYYYAKAYDNAGHVSTTPVYSFTASPKIYGLEISNMEYPRRVVLTKKWNDGMWSWETNSTVNITIHHAGTDACNFEVKCNIKDPHHHSWMYGHGYTGSFCWGISPGSTLTIPVPITFDSAGEWEISWCAVYSSPYGTCGSALEDNVTVGTVDATPSDCSYWTNETACESNGCKWCPECNSTSNKVNQWAADECVNTSVDCGYHCDASYCGAQCNDADEYCDLSNCYDLRNDVSGCDFYDYCGITCPSGYDYKCQGSMCPNGNECCCDVSCESATTSDCVSPTENTLSDCQSDLQSGSPTFKYCKLDRSMYTYSEMWNICSDLTVLGHALRTCPPG